MANICTNELFITTEDASNYSYLLEKVEYKLLGDVYHTTEEDIEASFESKWDFPLYEFTMIIENLPNKKDESLYLRVFSYEHGNYYHEYNVYTTEKGWEVY